MNSTTDPAIAKFLDQAAENKGWTTNTLEAYRNDLTQLKAFLGTRSWQQVTPEVLSCYIGGLRTAKDYRVSTLARKVAVLKSFFGFLVEQDVISKDPTDSLPIPKVPYTPPIVLLRTDVVRLLAQASTVSTHEGRRDATILQLLYTAGLKTSELVKLNVVDIDLQGSCLRCRAKESRNGIILLDSKMLESLRYYVSSIRPYFCKKPRETALFINYRGERLARQWVWRTLKANAKQAGIKQKVTSEILRRSRTA